jgi:hypothetical protein
MLSHGEGAPEHLFLSELSPVLRDTASWLLGMPMSIYGSFSDIRLETIFGLEGEVTHCISSSDNQLQAQERCLIITRNTTPLLIIKNMP